MFIKLTLGNIFIGESITKNRANRIQSPQEIESLFLFTIQINCSDEDEPQQEREKKNTSNIGNMYVNSLQ